MFQSRHVPFRFSRNILTFSSRALLTWSSSQKPLRFEKFKVRIKATNINDVEIFINPFAPNPFAIHDDNKTVTEGINKTKREQIYEQNPFVQAVREIEYKKAEALNSTLEDKKTGGDIQKFLTNTFPNTELHLPIYNSQTKIY